MKYDIQTVGFDATDELKSYLESQLSEIHELHDNITGIDVYLKSVNDDEEETKIAEIKVFIPGPSLYADHRSEKFDESIAKAVDKIKRQIKKTKEKQYAKR
ncbi:ribosome-associated translation inhibitor RaiA [Fulvivirga sp. RKSG066]|uniref:ribosome hibernation-promoting factor, HPF/YfiA family n=1 Tax=Fulvivirga aurantia TaxID=2529383 RepID=UPI0012BCBD9E|nr:ribosome-associated translation inhibitor RaiA [Fulvivirga aurantia]MTI22295.1 ribosome-associated translation inhibitor RaiA [Fulvivirga aurantia]